MSTKLDNATLTKYNDSARICGMVMGEIKGKINNGGMLDVYELCKYGDNRIVEECAKVYKKEKVKGVAFATCISLNDCVGYYIYEEGSRYNRIKDRDVVKIELGVNIGGCISRLGDTIIYNMEDEDENKRRYIRFLDDLQMEIVKYMVLDNFDEDENGEKRMTNDDMRMFIESKCVDAECFPVENTVSYQHLGGAFQVQESNYMVLNHKKYYDDDDNLIVEPNLCFDIVNDDVYTIDVTVVENKEDESEHVYKIPHNAHIMRYNECYYNLKLKNSRDFYSMVKTKYGMNAFNCIEYRKSIKNRVGIKESSEVGILEEYPIMYNKDGLNVYHKKFTVVVRDNKMVLLKYY